MSFVVASLELDGGCLEKMSECPYFQGTLSCKFAPIFRVKK
jgi:hypothetical protein